MDIQFGNPNSIYLIVIVAIGLAVSGWAIVAGTRAAQRFAKSNTRTPILPPGNRRAPMDVSDSGLTLP